MAYDGAKPASAQARTEPLRLSWLSTRRPLGNQSTPLLSAADKHGACRAPLLSVLCDTEILAAAAVAAALPTVCVVSTRTAVR